MTFTNGPLDRLAPAQGWVEDWDDVLRRAGELHFSTRRPGRPAFTRRRLALLLAAAAVAVVVPLAALAAANDWWFFRFGGAPTPAQAPTIVKQGEWDEHPWQLVAYPSTTDGLCFAVTPADSSSEGQGAAMACGPIVGVPRTQSTKPSPDMTITFLSGSASDQLPAYIAGPVVKTAQAVEVEFDTGEVLRVPTFAPPASVGPVRF
jgi:hypothetical protein